CLAGFRFVDCRNDGGKTWAMQDPKIPGGDGGHNNWFTGIQQIDSLNVVAIGAYGLVCRTTDGGETWKRQDGHTNKNIPAAHFSDPLQGIIVTYDSLNPIRTTSDGGIHWNIIPQNIFTFEGFSQCHSFGKGNFSVLATGIGPIYSTMDNWKTIDSTSFLIDTSADPAWSWYYFTNCVYHGHDTIVASGWYTLNHNQGAIVRSTDNGKHWEKPVLFPYNTGIQAISPFHNDTLIAAISRYVFLSSNAGESWRTDSLLLDTAYTINNCLSLDWTKTGPIGIFAAGNFLEQPGLILHGFYANSAVFQQTNQELGGIFPDPASTELTIKSHAGSQMIKLYDILGKEVERHISSDDGIVRFNVRGLPDGVYAVFSEAGGRVVSLGKCVISKR
ncbi:MAG: T9SS type A sorting domain-containing protein, partial [Ignavibacteriota bacterium]